MISRTSPSPRWWTLVILAALLSAGAYAAQVLAGGDVPLWLAVTLTSVGGIATAAVILLAAAQTVTEARTRREAEAAARDAEELAAAAVANFQVALNDIFLPFSEILNRAVTA